MILNLLLILLLVGMAVIWATYGLFSALLHLVILIVSGALALAVWEPVTYLLMGMWPTVAWGLGLLGPLIVFLLVLRITLDKLVRGNLIVHNLANQIGGGLVGLLSGCITAGLLLIGVGFLPVPASLAGYAPLSVQGSLVVDSPGGGLWVPVDNATAGFYEGLSEGAFAPLGDSLADRHPQLARAANRSRLAPDEHASRVAPPAAVSVARVVTMPSDGRAVTRMLHREALTRLVVSPQELEDIDDEQLATPQAVAELFRSGRLEELATGEAAALPGRFNLSEKQFAQAVQRWLEQLGENLRIAGATLDEPTRLVIVETIWQNTAEGAGAFDPADRIVRVPPSQVRLYTRSGDGEPVELVAPVAVSRQTGSDPEQRRMRPFVDDTVSAHGNQNSESFAWLFTVPTDAEPVALSVRNTYIPLPDGSSEPQLASTLAGAFRLPTQQAEAQDQDQVLVMSADLPATVNVNAALQLTSELRGETRYLMHGEQQNIASGGRGRRSTIREIYVEPNSALARLAIQPQTARSIFGQAVQSARMLEGIWVTDDDGNQHLPIGYVLQRADDTLDINVLASGNITSAQQTPISQMNEGDTLYMYIRVPRADGRTLVSYNLASETTPLNPPVPLDQPEEGAAQPQAEPAADEPTPDALEE